MRYTLRTFDDPALRATCEPVADGEDLVEIIAAMRSIKSLHGGIGLAAPQIGVLKRIILVRNAILINPVIVARDVRTVTGNEGCLSYPGVYVPITRPQSVQVECLDEWRRKRTWWYRALEARIVQHEVDHLDGICRVGEAWHQRKEVGGG